MSAFPRGREALGANMLLRAVALGETRLWSLFADMASLLIGFDLIVTTLCVKAHLALVFSSASCIVAPDAVLFHLGHVVRGISLTMSHWAHPLLALAAASRA